MAILTMSEREISRLDIIQRVVEKRLRQRQATQLLEMSTRQVQRLVQAYRCQGALGLISQRRGRPSNHQLPSGLADQAMALIRQRYADFGPTLATEKLREQHNLSLSKETVRRLMIREGLWVPRVQRLKAVHQPRHRRPCVGELIQIDGCDHDWFEDRGPRCTLRVFIDDATSHLMHLVFTATESTFTYFEATRAYLERHGKPVAFYSDKASIFRVNHKTALGGDAVTQFGRVLWTLNIDLLCANSSQAKGRVERAHQTLQDRLVKELRLRGLSTPETANAFLPEFMADYNRRFGKPPRSTHNAHRPVAGDEVLDDIFCWQVPRTLSTNLTLQYDKLLYLVEDSPLTRPLAGKKVTVFDYPDGRISIRYQGQELPCSAFDKLATVDQGEVVEHKRLNAVLALALEYQQQRDNRRSQSAPSRRHRGLPGPKQRLSTTTTPKDQPP